MAILLSVLAVTVTPTAANAGAIVPCPNGITEWKLIAYSRGVAVWEGYRFTTLSVTPQFLVSDGQLLDNGTDSPVRYTISSSRSQTFRVAATTGVTATPGPYLTANVSATIEMSRTTSIGVNLETTVPPRTRLIAEYGVDGYNVDYAIEAWRVRKTDGKTPVTGDQCEEWGWYPQHTIAPTHLEGWRLRTA
ncbi:hypothetical protein [Sphaerisporangium rhizosphaerae]